MEKLTVERTIWVDAPTERVWQAITQPKHLEQWFAPGCPWEIPALKVGERIKFYNTPTEILQATIEVVDPPKQFTLRWHDDPTYPDSNMVTTFSLRPENGGTRATIIESGYETLPEHIRQQHMAMAGEGYTASMEALKSFTEN
jgi:uncharacterized protein YndB with AHSA1/START domain